jgi:hypothetical protein
LARDDRKGRGGGGAWWGEALWRCVVRTGLRVDCGHRLSTRRRERFNDLSKTNTKAEGEGALLSVARNLRSASKNLEFRARTLRRGVNSRQRERFVAEKIIGRALRRRRSGRSSAGRRLVTVMRGAGQRTSRRGVIALAGWRLGRPSWRTERASGGVEVARAGVRVGWSVGPRVSADIAGGGQISLDQPSRQQGAAVFVHPRVEQLHDFLAHICRQIQAGHLVRLQSGLRGCQQKIPIHFLLAMLSQGASLMNAVRYPFINTRQGNSLPRTLWKYVQKPLLASFRDGGVWASQKTNTLTAPEGRSQ